MEYVLLKHLHFKQEGQSADTESARSLFHRNATEGVRNGSRGSGSVLYWNSNIVSRMHKSFQLLLKLDNCKVWRIGTSVRLS